MKAQEFIEILDGMKRILASVPGDYEVVVRDPEGVMPTEPPVAGVGLGRVDSTIKQVELLVQ